MAFRVRAAAVFMEVPPGDFFQDDCNPETGKSARGEKEEIEQFGIESFKRMAFLLTDFCWEIILTMVFRNMSRIGIIHKNYHYGGIL